MLCFLCVISNLCYALPLQNSCVQDNQVLGTKVLDFIVSSLDLCVRGVTLPTGTVPVENPFTVVRLKMKILISPTVVPVP